MPEPVKIKTEIILKLNGSPDAKASEHPLYQTLCYQISAALGVARKMASDGDNTNLVQKVIEGFGRKTVWRLICFQRTDALGFPVGRFTDGTAFRFLSLARLPKMSASLTDAIPNFYFYFFARHKFYYCFYFPICQQSMIDITYIMIVR